MPPPYKTQWRYLEADTPQKQHLRNLFDQAGPHARQFCNSPNAAPNNQSWVRTTIAYKQGELVRDDPYPSVLVLNFRDRDFFRTHVSVTLINTVLGLLRFTIRDFTHGGPDEYVDVEEVDPAFVQLLTQIRDEALNHLPPMVRVSGVYTYLSSWL
jgi:hypothetical protein